GTVAARTEFAASVSSVSVAASDTLACLGARHVESVTDQGDYSLGRPLAKSARRRRKIQIALPAGIRSLRWPAKVPACHRRDRGGPLPSGGHSGRIFPLVQISI